VKFLTWQNPEQLIVAQEFIKIFKILSCGIKGNEQQYCKKGFEYLIALPV